MATPQPAGKRRKLDLSDEWTVIVGQKKRRFTVAKCFLTKSSKYFQKCCEGDWQEGKTRTISILDLDVEAFGIYLQWLFTEELVLCDEAADFKPATPASPMDQRSAYVHARYPCIIKLAVLGDRLDDRALRNLTVDETIKIFGAVNLVPANTTISESYNLLPPTAKIRNLWVDLYMHLQAENIAAARNELPSDFLVDLTVAYRSKWIKGQPPKVRLGDRCKYHEHEDDEPKCI